MGKVLTGGLSCAKTVLVVVPAVKKVWCRHSVFVLSSSYIHNHVKPSIKTTVTVPLVTKPGFNFPLRIVYMGVVLSLKGVALCTCGLYFFPFLICKFYIKHRIF